MTRLEDIFKATPDNASAILHVGDDDDDIVLRRNQSTSCNSSFSIHNATADDGVDENPSTTWSEGFAVNHHQPNDGAGDRRSGFVRSFSVDGAGVEGGHSRSQGVSVCFFLLQPQKVT